MFGVYIPKYLNSTMQSIATNLQCGTVSKSLVRTSVFDCPLASVNYTYPPQHNNYLYLYYSRSTKDSSVSLSLSPSLSCDSCMFSRTFCCEDFIVNTYYCQATNGGLFRRKIFPFVELRFAAETSNRQLLNCGL